MKVNSRVKSCYKKLHWPKTVGFMSKLKWAQRQISILLSINMTHLKTVHKILNTHMIFNKFFIVDENIWSIDDKKSIS